MSCLPLILTDRPWQAIYLLVLWAILGKVPDFWSYRDIVIVLWAILGKLLLLNPVGTFFHSCELSRTSCLTPAHSRTLPPLESCN